MGSSIRILILEDMPADAELMEFELHNAGIDFISTFVATEKDFIAELESSPPDIILSDYDLPTYNGWLALAETRKRCPDVPFILVTGALSEDVAIEMIVAGARDYVMKSRLGRLAPAVRRALAESLEIRARKAAEEALRESDRQARIQLEEIQSIYDSAHIGLCVFDRELRYVRINDRMAEMNGVSKARHIGKTPREIVPDLAPVAEELAAHVFQTGEPVVGYEATGATASKNGVQRAWSTNWLPIRDGSGAIVAVNVVVEEITERKRLEDSLRKSHGILDERVRKRTAELQAEIDQRKQAEEELRRSEENTRRLARENELIAEIGRIIGSTLNIEDVYDRFAKKVIEFIPFDRLAVSTVDRNERTRTLRYVTGRSFSGDQAGTVVSLTGSGTGEVVRTKSSLLINGTNLGKMMRRLPHAVSLLSGVQSALYIPLIQKNEVIGVLVFQSADPDAYSENELRVAERVGSQIAGAVANARLFLELQQAQEAVRRSEKLYRILTENMKDVVWIVDTETRRFRYISPSVERLLGFTPEEMTAAPLDRAVLPAEAKYYFGLMRTRAEAFRRGTGTPDGFYIDELLSPCKDGSAVLTEVITYFTSNEETGHVEMCGVTRDITDRKRAELALVAAETKFRDLLENIQLIAVMLDRDGNVTFCNNYLLNLLGLSREEVLHRNWFDLSVPEECRSKVKKIFQTDLRTGTIVPHYENPVVTREGKLRQIIWDNTVVRDTDGRITGTASIGMDVTEHRQMEESLRRAEKMEALGKLAGGVAHDLNNVLGVLIGYSGMLLDEMPEESPWRTNAEYILKSSERGASIVDDLLTLARRGVSASKVINLDSITMAFLKSPAFEKLKSDHPDVAFKTCLDPAVLNMKGSPVHLEKTLMNLVYNAAEAITGAGEVFIMTENRYLDRPVYGFDEIPSGEYAALTVSDTGSGIAAADLSKIFEPFYTKKTMGKSGTGLGLAVVWGTVRDHKGYIDVWSEEGRGSTFTLYFPVTREASARDQRNKIPVAQYRGHGETVLVVDDVEGQRAFTTAVLLRLGYQVHAVSGGEGAMEYLKNHNADVMVLDMIMAGMDGLETYRRVLEINPKQKAILVSGFSETERVKEAQRLGAGAYVRKPYLPERIGVALRDELLKVQSGYENVGYA